CQQGYSYPRSF
nr:immunoglobulin light chain junction region [Macaca mulatta]